MDHITRHYAATPFGQLHYAECGSGPPLLLLHQTPRSSDEFREFLPLIGRHRRAIAMDLLGFGASPSLPAPQTIEQYAAGAFALLDALGIQQTDVLGHHTGAMVAVEMAAAAPDRVGELVLSSTGWSNADRAAHADDDPPVDVAMPRPDGGHLGELWNSRAPHYPAPATELLNRYLRDALTPGVDPAEGHKACLRYRIDQRIGLVAAPVLQVVAELDIFALRDVNRVRKGLTNASAVQTYRVAGGTVALFEVHADELASEVARFLS